MDERGGFVQKILFIHTVFIYTGCVHFVPFGGRKFDRRNEVLAETGGAVSALTPREHTVLRQQRAVTGPRGNACSALRTPVVAGGGPGSRSWKGRTIGQGRRRRRQAGISWQRAAERYVSLLCSLTTGDARMGGMDIIILILKLMVAVLQLLDAVLKQFR